MREYPTLVYALLNQIKYTVGTGYIVPIPI